jgi:hypothetical protein
MTWKCNLILNPPLNGHGNVDWDKLSVGDMWYLDLPEEELRQRHLTQYYWTHNSGRKPLVVKLPGPLYFVADGQCFNGRCTVCNKHWCEGHEPQRRGYYDAWTVTGTPPLISVHPSIHYEGSYHGWLTGGVIGDDVDGRKFDAQGQRVPT